MLKQITTIALFLCVAGSLSACGGGQEDGTLDKLQITRSEAAPSTGLDAEFNAPSLAQAGSETE